MMGDFIGPIQWPTERLFNIFQPTQAGTSQMWAYCEIHLAAHVREGRLRVGELNLPPLIEGKPLWREFIQVRHRGNESEEHRWLKLVGRRFLCSKGAKDAEYEGAAYYGPADVVSDDLALTVECGNTPPARVETILFSSHPGMLVLPYPLVREAPAAFLFVATEAGRAYGRRLLAAEYERQQTEATRMAEWAGI